MENTNVLFDRKRLVRLIVPLIVEQVLAVTVGMADMVMVSGAGETAVSGISLVNTICVLLIVIFTSMASGGSVVGAQFLGSGDKKTACHAAEQLVMICGLIAQQEARRMKEENYEVVVFQGDPGTIDLTYEEIEAEWNKVPYHPSGEKEVHLRRLQQSDRERRRSTWYLGPQRSDQRKAL